MNQLQEYRFSLFAAGDGGFALDVQPLNASGTSPYARFSSWNELLRFLGSLDLSDELLAQVEDIVLKLDKGKAFHQQMYLPSKVEERLAELSQQTA
jgi:hypothetical protein